MTHRARRAWGMALALLSVPAGAAQTVRYCDYPVYPPMSWSDGHQVRGLAPTVVRELFARMGYDVQTVVLGNWKRCLMDAAAGRVDVVLAYNSDQRDQRMHFSTEPVVREEVAVFYNRKRPVQFQQLEDLAGYRGGLLYGESYGAEFDRFVARHQNIERVSSSQQNFGKLIRGRIDYVIQERRTGQLFIEHLPGAQDIRVLPSALSVDYLRVAVSRQSPLSQHMDEIDAQLWRMNQAGEITRWLEQSEVTYRDMINLPADAR
ncbi:transporter substrate-binding domain-containing protein [Pseudomonas putida]|uniref:substrate-binding periplasmic protein n=1 Tax=Pseudomonas putida TaxID=303 RepID=UPI0018D8B7C7|nr:transporter substrate-binding domain-containing protein [Pseudomonas putida]MBH3392216.1 transporter substrate-binding domain-containing protein [Pseudomonas putida]